MKRCESVCVCALVTHLHGNRFFQPLILGHQRAIGRQYVVNGDTHDGLQVTTISLLVAFSFRT